MTFIESIQTCYKKSFDFKGTASRSEYWWFALYSLILYAGIVLPSAFINTTFGSLIFFVYVLFYIYTQIAATAAGARRLHDTGKSGWWQLLLFVPLIGALILIVQLSKPSEFAQNKYRSN
jgi:uncharacterized membrane protein YhaH (DUF805 family)